MTASPPRTARQAGIPRRAYLTSFMTLVTATLLIATPVRGGAPAPFVLDDITSLALGGNAEMVVDPAERTHFVAWDAAENDIIYGVENGLSWDIEEPETAGDFGFVTDIVVDSAGNPHLLYVETDPGFTFIDCRYAVKVGGSWTFETAASDAIPGGIALGPGDIPYIAFHGQNDDRVGIASREGGSWGTELAGSDMGFVEPRDIAIDDIGRVHLAYEGFGADVLYKSRDTDGTWTATETIATSTTVEDVRLALDAGGHPSVLYLDHAGSVNLAERGSGAWVVETVIPEFQRDVSLAIDATGDPHVAYRREPDGDAAYAVRRDGIWSTQIVDGVTDAGFGPSIALDRYGNPRIVYGNGLATTLRIANASLQLAAPLGGETWTVGDTENVTWRGAGLVDVEISADGGATFQTLLDDVSGTSLSGGLRTVELLVPHLPSALGVVRVVRDAPRSVAQSGLVRVESNIALLRLIARPADGRDGVLLEWSTDPGSDALAGYRVDRLGAGGWVAVAPLVETTSFLDTAGEPGDRYRLYGINGLGQERLLGETFVSAGDRLVLAWPQPYRAGTLHVTFPTAGGLGGGSAAVDVRIYDVTGRRVRDLLRADLPAGIHEVLWDGRGARGAPVPAGAYLVDISGGTTRLTKRVVVLR